MAFALDDDSSKEDDDSSASQNSDEKLEENKEGADEDAEYTQEQVITEQTNLQ